MAAGSTSRHQREPNGSHWGLINMKERAENVGGTLRVTSAPRRGHADRGRGLPHPAGREIAEMERSRIRVLCVDDHRIVREGIGLIIDRQKDMKVVASAADGEEAVSCIARTGRT